jgi:hypothetical protein
MRSRGITRLAGIGAAVLMTAAVAQAQPEDKRTYFTFNRPIALPGATLPAGRYLFRIVDADTSRKVVQVLSGDGKKPIAMMNTITDERSVAAKDPEVSFIETPRNAPSAVKTWWYPGERVGYEFIYPRAQARALARSSGSPVLTTKTESTKAEETKTGELSRINPAGQDEDVAVNRVPPSPAPVTQQADRTSVARQPAPAPPSEPQAAPRSSAQADKPVATSGRAARSTLPTTATQLPLIGLIGIGSLLAFAGLRLRRRHQS